MSKEARYDLKTSPLFLCIEQNKDASTISDVISGIGNIDIRDLDGNTPLIRACFLGNLPVVKLLHSLGADINTSNDIGYTALHFATQERLTHIVKWLLDAGAKVDSVDNHGNTPLFRAVFEAESNDDPIVNMLIKSGANPLNKNKHGVSPKDLSETRDIKFDW